MALNLNGRIDIPINPEPPEVMHIDLNSAFAMAEQQWRPHLRRRAVGITNRIKQPGTQKTVPWSICITSSYEAKRQGITIGTKHRDATNIDQRFVMLESDPAKYIHVHRKLKAIFQSYSPHAFMKSIDEGIIDFRGQRRLLKGRPLADIGREIKQRVRDEIGDYMTVNVGIAQNFWLAKVAASLHKPDGLEVIDAHNLVDIYRRLRLMELPYIKGGNATRLNLAGIYSTLEFFNAPYWVLFRQVFGSVLGHHWYLKLRGYETEQLEFEIKSAGRSYVLEHRTSDPVQLLALLHKAAFKVSRKLYAFNLEARGLSLRLRYAPGFNQIAEPDFVALGWQDKKMWKSAVHRQDEIYHRAKYLFDLSPAEETVKAFELTTYGLAKRSVAQPTLFDDDYVRQEKIHLALDQLNDKYGELTVVTADVKMSKNPMRDKIPFYSTQYYDITQV